MHPEWRRLAPIGKGRVWVFDSSLFFSLLGFALCFLCGGSCRTKKQMLFLDAPLRMAVRAVKGGGLSRSSKRSDDPLQEKRAEQAHAFA